MLSTFNRSVQDRLRESTHFLLAALMVLSSATPFLLQGNASAETLSVRKVTISSSEIHNGTTNINDDVEFAFSFTIPNTTATKGGIRYEFCTQPQGACVLPSSMNVQTNNDFVSQSGWPTNGTNFVALAETADVGDCTLNTNSYMNCYSRDETATATTGGAVTHVISGIEAPDAYLTVYVKITLYSDNDFGSGDRLDEGTVAAAFVKQLTVTGRVQERLNFCVSALGDGTAADTTVTALNSVADCAALTDTTVDIGVVDNSTPIEIAPVDNTPPTLLGDDTYGIAMINTNASGGTALTFFVDPVIAGTTAAAGETDFLRNFRVNGSTVNCTASDTDYQDQCFRSAAAAGTTLTAFNEEWFGMYVPCVATSQGDVATPMTVDADFNGFDNDTAHSVDCENSDKADNGGLPQIAWNVTGTATEIASAATVLDDVIVKMSFAASANGTTPTGTYQVVSTYIATPTF